MKLIIRYPERRSQFRQALESLTAGLSPSDQPTREAEEIIEKAVEFVPKAVENIREYVDDQLGFLDATFEVDPTTVAMLAIAMTLEELEDWIDEPRQEILLDLATELYTTYRRETGRYV